MWWTLFAAPRLLITTSSGCLGCLFVLIAYPALTLLLGLTIWWSVVRWGMWTSIFTVVLLLIVALGYASYMGYRAIAPTITKPPAR